MVSTLPVDDLLRNLSIKDLRMQCRARGINPAGSADSLRERIQDDMNASSDFNLHAAAPEPTPLPFAAPPAGVPAEQLSRPHTRSAHGTGGGASQIHFGDDKPDYAAKQYGDGLAASQVMHANVPAAGEDIRHAATPNGGRPMYSSGGGHSQVAFGSYQLPSSKSGRAGLVPTKTEEDVKHEEVSISISDTVKPLLLKDLRIQLRARGLSPAGTVEELRQRLAEDMMATGNLALALDVNLLNPYAQGVIPPGPPPAPAPAYNPSMAASGRTPAGGQSQISFGDYTLPSHGQPKQAPAPAPAAHGAMHAPWDQGGTDNFRPSSRHIEPPGGRGNQIQFG